MQNQNGRANEVGREGSLSDPECAYLPGEPKCANSSEGDTYGALLRLDRAGWAWQRLNRAREFAVTTERTLPLIAASAPINDACSAPRVIQQTVATDIAHWGLLQWTGPARLLFGSPQKSLHFESEGRHFSSPVISARFATVLQERGVMENLRLKELYDNAGLVLLGMVRGIRDTCQLPVIIPVPTTSGCVGG